MIRKSLLLVALLASMAGAAADSITQYGITFVYDRTLPKDTFANGDWWVAGDTVILTAIRPDTVWGYHGYQFDPIAYGELYSGTQGLSRYIDVSRYDSSLIPALPCTVVTTTTPKSLIKVISDTSKHTEGTGRVTTAAVLTFLKTQPANSGHNMFRPPYVGISKPFTYYVDSLDTALLPSYAPVAHSISLDTLRGLLSRVQMDHLGRNGHPVLNLPDYGPTVGERNAAAVVRLMLNDTRAAKMPLLIKTIQYGIDLYQMRRYGQHWGAGAGHKTGQKIILAFTATMLDNDSMKAQIGTATVSQPFGDEDYSFGKSLSGTILFGNFTDTAGRTAAAWDSLYWWGVKQFKFRNSDVLTAGDKSWPDPYKIVDGGTVVGDTSPGGMSYLLLVASSIKGTVTALELMSSLRTTLPDTTLQSFMRRWITRGAIFEDDTCADCDSSLTWENYRTTYGPNGVGGCIKGTGRFTNRKLDYHENAWKDYPTYNPGVFHLFYNDMYNTYVTTADTAVYYGKPFYKATRLSTSAVACSSKTRTMSFYLVKKTGSTKVDSSKGLVAGSVDTLWYSGVADSLRIVGITTK